MTSQDIRWIEHFNHFTDAVTGLQEAVLLSKKRRLSHLEQLGLIQMFKLAHELTWNTLKDFSGERGEVKLFGSKDTTREALETGLIEHVKN